MPHCPLCQTPRAALQLAAGYHPCAPHPPLCPSCSPAHPCEHHVLLLGKALAHRAGLWRCMAMHGSAQQLFFPSPRNF